MIRCFECKHVNTNVEYECASGVGDYYCRDCCKRNNFICPFCGSDLVLIEGNILELRSGDDTNKKTCQFCGILVESDWKYCPHCAKELTAGDYNLNKE